jgi:hypothetical protein
VAGNEHGPAEEPGVIRRPDVSILADEALVPERNVVRPAPNRFTHELLADEPYRFDRPERPNEPDGVLPAGTQVVLLVEGGDSCRVVDGSGLYVEISRTHLRKLPDA